MGADALALPVEADGLLPRFLGQAVRLQAQGFHAADGSLCGESGFSQSGNFRGLPHRLTAGIIGDGAKGRPVQAPERFRRAFHPAGGLNDAVALRMVAECLHRGIGGAIDASQAFSELLGLLVCPGCLVVEGGGLLAVPLGLGLGLLNAGGKRLPAVQALYGRAEGNIRR